MAASGHHVLHLSLRGLGALLGLPQLPPRLAQPLVRRVQLAPQRRRHAAAWLRLAARADARGPGAAQLLLQLQHLQLPVDQLAPRLGLRALGRVEPALRTATGTRDG